MHKFIAITFFFLATTYSKGQIPHAFDTTFNHVGYYINTKDSSVINNKAIGLQSTNKIINAGTITASPYNVFFIDRYLPIGIPDTSFGIGGRVKFSITGLTTLNEMLVQPDDYIILLGDHQIGLTKDMIIARFKPDGEIDSTFGVNGWVVYDISGGNNETMNTLVLQSTNKIIVGGSVYNTSISNFDFGFARLNTNGTLDNSFNTTGIKLVNLGGNDFGFKLGVKSGDQLIMVGYINAGADGFGTVSLTANGDLDTSFINDGVDSPACIVCTGDYGRTIAVLPDDRYIVSGDGMDWGGDIYITTRRFLPNGTIDTSFNHTSHNITFYSPEYIGNTATVASPSGKVLVGGTTYTTIVAPPHNKFASLIRYNSDGTHDASFGSGTLVNYEILNAPQTLQDLQLQFDGKALFCGETFDSTSMSYFSYVARIENNNEVTTNSAQLISQNTFNVYPNPAKDHITINSEYSFETLVIINSMGQQVNSYNSMSKKSITIDIHNLDQGVYLIKLNSSKNTVAKKIIINKL